jgi:flagellar protein FliS
VFTADFEQYRNIQVNTASGVNLVIMVLDGVLKHLNLAQAAIKSGQMENASKSITKVHQLLAELRGSLNFEAGDIATKLYRLYEFCGKRMADAQFRGDPAMLDAVKDIITTLRQAWVECSKKGFKDAPGGSTGFQVMVG